MNRPSVGECTPDIAKQKLAMEAKAIVANLDAEDAASELASAIECYNEFLALCILCKYPDVLNQNPRADGCYTGDLPLLHAACENDCATIVGALIDAGADVNEIADISWYCSSDVEEIWLDYYYTPMLAAYRYQHLSCMCLLIKSSASLSLGGNLNYLHAALYDKHMALADVIMRRNDFSSDIFCALGFGDIEEVERLVGLSRAVACERLFSEDSISSDYGRNETALHWAARSCSSAIPCLLRAGADINAVDNSNRTPLHWGIEIGSVAAVRELLVYGASVSVCSSQGTPLKYALRLEDDFEGDKCIQNIIGLLREYSKHQSN